MPEVPGRSWPVEIRHRLRIAREEAGLSQTELAEAIGISRRSITSYESGDAQPKRPVIIAWALRTGASSEWLVTGRVSGDTPPGLDTELTVTKEPRPRPNRENRRSGKPAIGLSVTRRGASFRGDIRDERGQAA